MTHFNGFSPEAIKFLTRLKANNRREWFQQHYEFYEQEILEKSRDLVEDLGASLQLIAPGINVVPKVNGSIYRFSRDTRFSRDKTPYKTHLSFLFWQGLLKRTRCPGFYLGIQPEHISIGVGINHFQRDYLDAWRLRCLNPAAGILLRTIIDELVQKGFIIHGEQLKRMPAGLSSQHYNQDLVRYKGFGVFHQHSLTNVVYNESLIEHCMDYYLELLPLFKWLVAVLDDIPSNYVHDNL